ncbi:MAG: PorV/PorQ family protein [Candidatus Cryptobacteroides sp.]
MTFSLTNPSASVSGVAGLNISGRNGSAWSAFSNPSMAVMGTERMDCSASWMLFSPSEEHISYFAVGSFYKIKEKYAIAAAVRYGLCKEINSYGNSGTQTGTFRPGQTQASVGFGYRPIKLLSAGVNVHFLNEKLYESKSYNVFAADVTLSVSVPFGNGHRFMSSAGVYSLGTPVTSVSGNKFQLPAHLNFEAGYSKNWDEENLLEILSGTNWYFFSKSASVSLAAVYSFRSMLTLRCGYRYGGTSSIPSYASVGVGLSFFGVSLDASYLFGSATIANSVGVTLGYSF